MLNDPLGYPLSKIGADYLRSAIGAALCLLPLAFGTPLKGGVWLLVALASMFVLFAVRTFTRQITRVWVSDEGIAVSGFIKQILRWEMLSEVTLSYYSTFRGRGQGRGQGWMQLRLRGGGQTLRLESSLEGFDRVARHAVDAARRNGLALQPSTVKNLGAMGIEC